MKVRAKSEVFCKKEVRKTSFDNNNNYTTTTITSKKKVNQGEEDIANILSVILNDLPYKKERLVTCAEEQNEKSDMFYMCKCMIVISENN